MEQVHENAPAGPAPESLLTRGRAELAQIHRRRCYISSPETQHLLVRQFMLVLCTGMALGLANAYVIASFSHVEISVLPDATPLETSLVIAYVASMVMASLGVVMLLAIFYSHRVGGPAFRITTALLRMADGDLRGRIKLRETDLLHDVAQASNELAMTVQRALREVDAGVARLRECDGLDDGANECLGELESVLRRFGASTTQAGKPQADAGNRVLELQRRR